ncbi:uncharacterized protein pnhd [Clarias gariepinus]|uniref:uncharacterized protein pnhd n=1 Tax=Clarias gariepinus TaxID=13013 RepID=UPI00234D382C|nr:uncharacterized protein pnhd [Clarias gariepinus]
MPLAQEERIEIVFMAGSARTIAVDMVLLSVFLLLSFCHQSLTAVLNMHFEPRNMFAERACCRRQSHFIYIGQDILGSPVNVDVGMCRTSCQARSSSFEAGMQGYSSMLDFLRDKKTRSPSSASSHDLPGFGRNRPSCGASMTCEPTGLRVDKVMLMDGLREVEIIEDCHCEAKVTSCVRAPSLRTYFFETPYETVIDVGKCVGSKGEPEGFSCVPTKFDSALVDTPNKVELIQTVAGCDMKEGCYRIPYVEYHYEITYNEDGLKEEKLKEIDVGRCLGSCTSGNRCLLRNASDSGECLLWAEGQGSACVPQGYESHTFLNQHGQFRTVLAITSCLCQS